MFNITFNQYIYAYINKEIIRKLEYYFICICTCIFTSNEILHFTNDIFNIGNGKDNWPSRFQVN